ncbi:hypothetical protein CHS0354_022161 [Potamilus streckersoni]|uniref:BHLH domain-containing protein n=1 Tax=Potamilus streckersoni TaxID=2493646 RepID=A0AAE0RT33_9BIVA|nr:hypothetical protein CHS0354_022161 [Potamilus streckersoni]
MADSPCKYSFDNCNFEEYVTDDSYSPASDSPGPFRNARKRGRPMGNNAARERSRVKSLRSAFLDLQKTLPAVPPDTKLSKLDVLVLATAYIAHLMSTLHDESDISRTFAAHGVLHPVKKWPMRTRLYAGILSSTMTSAEKEERCNQEIPAWVRARTQTTELVLKDNNW